MVERDTRPQQHHATTTIDCEPQAYCYRAGYRPNRGQPNPLPLLIFVGRWLEALGFCTFQAVNVASENVRLIIKPQRKIR